METAARGNAESDLASMFGLPAQEFMQCRMIAEQRIVDIANQNPVPFRGLGKRSGQFLQQPVILFAMRAPVIGGNRLPASRRIADPFAPVGDDVSASGGNGQRIARTDQLTIVAAFHDIVRAAAVRSDHRQTGRCRFEQGQAERFVQCRVYEHPATLARYGVISWNVCGIVVFWIGDLPVKVIPIDRLYQLLHDLAAFGLQIAKQRPAASHDHEICSVLQGRVGGIGFHQPEKVFLPDRSGDGEQYGFGWVAQELRQIGTNLFARLRAFEPMEIAARRNDADAPCFDRSIMRVLRLRLVARAGDDGIGHIERSFLDTDACPQAFIHAAIYVALYGAKRVARKDVRYAKLLLRMASKNARIRIMGMYDIWQAIEIVQIFEEGRAQFFVPFVQSFFRQI